MHCELKTIKTTNVAMLRCCDVALQYYEKRVLL